jgi:hypothetical protein
VIIAMRPRSALIWLITAGVAALACVPAVVVFALGWLRLPELRGFGEQPAPDTTPPWAWALFALFYLVWAAGLGVLLVWAFDRVGHHWRPYDRPPRPDRQSKRRARATLQAIDADRRATAEALRRREEREARRLHDRERDEAWRRGPGGGAGARDS